MRKSSFKKHIEQLGEEELRLELELLFERIKQVKEYYGMELGSETDRQKQYVKAKAEIEAKYRTKSIRRPRRPRIQKVKKILSELEKLSVFSHELIDVYLYDVETALKFVRRYNYFTKVLFNNIINSFSKALLSIESNMMQEDYRERCTSILDKCVYLIELHRELKQLFDKVYS